MRESPCEYPPANHAYFFSDLHLDISSQVHSGRRRGVVSFINNYSKKFMPWQVSDDLCLIEIERSSTVRLTVDWGVRGRVFSKFRALNIKSLYSSWTNISVGQHERQESTGLRKGSVKNITFRSLFFELLVESSANLRWNKHLDENCIWKIW